MRNVADFNEHKVYRPMGLKMRTNLFVCSVAVLISACGENGGTTAPVENVSFSADVQPIFTANCTSLGCHIAPNSQLGMELNLGQAYTNIVGVQAVQATMPRVTPGQSSASYLYQKVIDAQVAAGGSGHRMPPEPRTALDSDELETIRVWIEEGALNN